MGCCSAANHAPRHPCSIALYCTAPLAPAHLPAVPPPKPSTHPQVVGHTIQEGGITSACQGRVLRIDVGLSRGCGDGSPEVGWPVPVSMGGTLQELFLGCLGTSLLRVPRCPAAVLPAACATKAATSCTSSFPRDAMLTQRTTLSHCLLSQVLEIVDDRVVRRLSEMQQENLAPTQQAQQQQAGESQKAREQAAAAAAAVVAGLQAAEAARPAAVLQSSSS